MRFIFLQGNATQFFPALGHELTARGHKVLRVSFNGGDDLSWSVGQRHAFREHPERWPQFLARILTKFQPDAILLFGQWRPFHQQAITVADYRNIPVWIFDEGYIRPNRVRMERAGPGGKSQVPSSPQEILHIGKTSDISAPPILPPSTFTERAFLDIAYHLRRAITWPSYPHHRFHTPVSPFIEYLGYAKQIVWNSLPFQQPQYLPPPETPYFLFPMQMDGDFQVRVCSRFGGNRAAIEEVIASFANCAEPACHLVLKTHPLDNGLINWRRVIRKIAAHHGVEKRTHYTASTELRGLIARARGVVTINSTVGIMALETGRPVIPLGEAIYALPGLTFHGGLNRFWREAVAPDATLVKAFCNVVIERTAIPGDFFSPVGAAMAVMAAADRLEQTVNLSSTPPSELFPQAR